jgi:hypothetical protein
MLIRYNNGKLIEGVVLSENENSMRVAVRGAADAAEYTFVNGVWISEDCEPVQIQFEWERTATPEVINEEDCICSKELAAHLLQLLFSGDEEHGLAVEPCNLAAMAVTAAQRVM